MLLVIVPDHWQVLFIVFSNLKAWSKSYDSKFTVAHS